MKNFFGFCVIFIAIGLLANWFWFPAYIMYGITIGGSALILFLFFVGIYNIIKERKEMRRQRENLSKNNS